jgi:hypothetical protein
MGADTDASALKLRKDKGAGMINHSLKIPPVLAVLPAPWISQSTSLVIRHKLPQTNTLVSDHDVGKGRAEHYSAHPFALFDNRKAHTPANPLAGVGIVSQVQSLIKQFAPIAIANFYKGQTFTGETIVRYHQVVAQALNLLAS